MKQKIKVFLAVLAFWSALFIIWEWWRSFPRVRIKPAAKVNSMQEGVDSILQQAMSTYLLPSVSVAIVKKGEVVYLDAFGYENLDTKDSLTVDSKILVASISKIFTALGVAGTLQKSGISATDSLAALGLKDINTSSLANLQFGDLLSHTSGLRDKNFREKIMSSSKTQTLHDWGVGFQKTPHTTDYGYVGYFYADSNFDLLGYLLAESEQDDFSTLMQREVFASSGMLNSEFVNIWPIEETGITGYQKTFLWKRIGPKKIKFQILPSPSSGLVTTTKDMSLALSHLLKGHAGAYSEALSWLDTEDEIPLGFQKIQLLGADWIGHFGGQAGYSSLLFYSNETDTGIFLFSNSRDEQGFRTEIAIQVLSYISP
ncbi:CubicO group peptidase, beta-lactamase class C family [Algoriphagus locisalis]|uniref:CubicO group peptidase, beta-lactamase class C family n=1 Tax=Algoriphagus locisalis TaxID=305507 RepID=A0A1I7DLH6_9BACT|nr:serine hydrolase domain-containing protein [Algoriphagus locisalis]SFU12539.1 CubicO group peptidase, beta-lactamase class C family [Algoriphagus locisalis]